MTAPLKAPMKAPVYTQTFIPGPVGRLDTACLAPAHEGTPLGIALVAHPNPTQGGTNRNKIVHTLAKVLSRRGYQVYCPNLRGVGESEGNHDEGRGEVDDMAAVLAHARAAHPGLPLVLAGFSFGCFVQSQLAERLQAALSEQGGEAPADALARLILIAPACSKWTFPARVPANTLLIHGEHDDVAPLQATLDWARPQMLPVWVVPGVGHFFHGHITLLAELLNSQRL